MDHEVDVTDRRGNPTGQRLPLGQVWQRGLWHRAVQVVVYTPAGQVLVQQRSRGNYVYAGQLDISLAGGVQAGETPAQAAARETAEELGITAAPLGFIALPPRRYNHRWIRHGVQPHTVIYPFLLKLPGEVPLKLQSSEVASARWVSWRQARGLARRHAIRHWAPLIRRYAFYNYLLKAVRGQLKAA